MFRPTTVIRPTIRTISQSRFASSSATDTAKETLGKAQAALGGVGASAGKAFQGITETAGNALGAYREPIFTNAAVAREVLKQVYVQEKLAPPSLAQVTQTYQSFFSSAQNLGFWQKLYYSGEYKKWLLYAVEAYGIFKIGEMVGRRHIVGYKLDESKHRHLETST